ncbi:hypothetical protein RQP53_05060 [Paucibacter sp. APW11]|uniref:Uncharacterized protein n=1 Tax=Roseateles aquae TaxID=3077235 RepID=A0ABU3P7U4_9BURK|nr:hypothetical protein [Paucibacter sp. APW11]MDT8998637.1 hypothetical protein [Paucibacter sp. APW11]
MLLARRGLRQVPPVKQLIEQLKVGSLAWLPLLEGRAPQAR